MSVYRIYISSTQKDLKEERLNLKASLEQVGYDPRCMEKYPAYSERPKNVCEKDVASAHFYVCVIGDRYGSAPIIDGVQQEKSFTEYEYEAAVLNKIPVFAFIKKMERNPPDEKLQKFMNRLYAEHVVGEFTDADDLSKQVLIALQNKTGVATVKGINPEKKYFCNREDQSTLFDNIFYLQKATSEIHFFLLAGHVMDCHNSFAERYKCEFKLKSGNEEPGDINFNIKIIPADHEDKIVSRIKGLINDGLRKRFDIPPLAVVDAENLFEFMHKLQKKFLIIRMDIESTSLKEPFAEIYKKSVQKFINEFSGYESEKHSDKKIIFFLNLKYGNVTASDALLKSCFEENPDYKDLLLPPLTKITTGDIGNWLEFNSIEKNPGRIYKLLSEQAQLNQVNMADLTGEGIYMSDAEIIMDAIINHYNKQTN